MCVCSSMFCDGFYVQSSEMSQRVLFHKMEVSNPPERCLFVCPREGHRSHTSPPPPAALLFSAGSLALSSPVSPISTLPLFFSVALLLVQWEASCQRGKLPLCLIIGFRGLGGEQCGGTILKKMRRSRLNESNPVVNLFGTCFVPCSHGSPVTGNQKNASGNASGKGWVNLLAVFHSLEIELVGVLPISGSLEMQSLNNTFTWAKPERMK